MFHKALTHCVASCRWKCARAALKATPCRLCESFLCARGWKFRLLVLGNKITRLPVIFFIIPGLWYVALCIRLWLRAPFVRYRLHLSIVVPAQPQQHTQTAAHNHPQRRAQPCDCSHTITSGWWLRAIFSVYALRVAAYAAAAASTDPVFIRFFFMLSLVVFFYVFFFCRAFVSCRKAHCEGG